MDLKASAKSMRAHTLRGRRSHPSAVSTAATQKKKAAAESSVELPANPPRSRDIPNNWDRYYESDNDDPVECKISLEEVKPKSKGADFGFLLRESVHQTAPNRDLGSHLLSTNDEIHTDFMHGIGSLLSSRGKALLSLCEDDNFIVDDDSTTNFKVPYLSLDLNKLAAELSKLKCSQRLFIEPDFLPQELEMGKKEAHDQLGTLSSSKGEDNKHLYSRTDVESLVPVSSSIFSHLTVEDPDKVEHPQVDGFKGKLASENTFKATDAEAELDFLLESFGEVNPTRSISSDAGPSAAAAISSFSIEDDIDDLLAMTNLASASSSSIIGVPGLLPGPSTEQGDVDFDSWLDTLH